MALTEVISLNRTARIRVKTYDGSYKNLSPEVSRWIDFDDAYNRKQLNHHSSIGQWISTCSDTGTPSENTWFGVAIRGLSVSARVRVKGWRDSTETYGLWDLGHVLRENPNDVIYINLGAYDGNNDPNDGRYNRIQLNHHRAIGQYVHSQVRDWAGLKALNRSVKVRVKDSNGNVSVLTTTGYTWLDLSDRAVLRSLNHHAAIGQWCVSEFWD